MVSSFEFQPHTWADNEHADAHTGWVRTSWEAMRPHTTGDPYLSFLGDERSDRVRVAYGPEALERLVELKTRYDPDNVFRLNQNIAPR
ncbi:MAG: BBE domain-containing protein [Acidimicrobiia bacterium]|nr:BBE domain-containing protein [Acidimicrobiia bacterium]